MSSAILKLPNNKKWQTTIQTKNLQYASTFQCENWHCFSPTILGKSAGREYVAMHEKLVRTSKWCQIIKSSKQLICESFDIFLLTRIFVKFQQRKDVELLFLIRRSLKINKFHLQVFSTFSIVTENGQKNILKRMAEFL